MKFVDRFWRNLRKDLMDETRGNPDFIDIVDRSIKERRKILDFPKPDPNGITAGIKSRAYFLRESRRLIGIHAHDVDIGFRTPRRTFFDGMTLPA